jgi:hypothetical protein
LGSNAIVLAKRKKKRREIAIRLGTHPFSQLAEVVVTHLLHCHLSPNKNVFTTKSSNYISKRKVFYVFYVFVLD